MGIDRHDRSPTRLLVVCGALLFIQLRWNFLFLYSYAGIHKRAKDYPGVGEVEEMY
jgi:hypothetical protein